MSELLACPFCGGAGEVLRDPSAVSHPFLVQCRSCASESGGLRTEAEAIAAWNRRTPQTEGDGRVGELEAARWNSALWEAFCNEAEAGTFPLALLNDAKEMGAGVFEIHYGAQLRIAGLDTALRGDGLVKP